MGAGDICCNWHYNNVVLISFFFLIVLFKRLLQVLKYYIITRKFFCFRTDRRKKDQQPMVAFRALVSFSTVKLHTFNFQTKLHFAHFQIPSCTLQKHRLSHHMACWGLDHIARVSLCSAEAGVHYNGKWCVLFCSRPYLLYESADINEQASFLP